MVFRRLKWCVERIDGISSLGGYRVSPAQRMKADHATARGLEDKMIERSGVREGWRGLLRYMSPGSLKNRSTTIRKDLKYTPRALRGPFMDGLTRYDIDFLEDVNWVKHILLSMKAISINKDGLVVNKNESGEIRSKTPMCFESRRTYEYDFSKLPNPDTNVVMHVRVKNLDLSEEERHKLRVIATPNYDADSDVIKLTSDYNFKLGEGVENPLNKMANKVILARALSDLISDSKVNPHEFTDIPTGVGDSLAAPVPPKKPRHKKKLARQQRLVLLKCRTKQKFEYVMNRRKHNFIL